MNTSIHQKLREISRIAVHKGLIRTLERFFEEENLPAKDWPPYVKKEILEKIPLKLRPGYVDDPKELESIFKGLKTKEGLKTFNDFSIQFEPTPKFLQFKSDLSQFTGNTKNKLEQRINLPPSMETSGIPHDIERKKKQKELVSEGKDLPPVILLKQNNSYEIKEGWHRAMALIEKAREIKSDTFPMKTFVGKQKGASDLLGKFKNFLRAIKPLPGNNP